MYKNTKAFTLVELIVTITILAILSTIGFISYSSYLEGVRDTNRISQLKSISDGLNLYSTKYSLPLPDDKIDIKEGTDIIAYQGYVGKDVLETLEYSSQGVDPKDDSYFLYYLTSNRKHFQLMAFLEEQDDLQITGILTDSYAADYSSRYPTVYGKKLGMLVTELNVPVQDTVVGSLDISNLGSLTFKSYLRDNEYITGSGNSLSALGNISRAGGKYYSVTNGAFAYYNPNSISTVTYQNLGLCNQEDINIPNGCLEGNEGCYILASCNLGSTLAGTISTNYGDSFQWGNISGFTIGSSASPTSSTKQNTSSNGPSSLYSSGTFITGTSSEDWSLTENDNLWGYEDYVAGGSTNNTLLQGPCPENYHVPLQSEWQGVIDALGNPVGTTMRDQLKLPFVRYHNYDGSNYGSTSGGSYWIASPSVTDSYSYKIHISESSTSTFTPTLRSYGYAVRCFKN